MKLQTTEYSIEVVTPKRLEQRRFTDMAASFNWRGVAIVTVYLLIYANMAMSFLIAHQAMLLK